MNIAGFVKWSRSHSGHGFAPVSVRGAVILAVALRSFIAVTGLEAQTIRVHQDTPVPLDLDGRALIEPHLAVHPTNPNHLLAAAMITVGAATFEERASRTTCATMVSTDGGESWRRHDFPLTWCWDPWVAITPDGRAVFATIAAHPDFPQAIRGGVLVVYHSPDGGQTWEDHPVGLGRGHDHESIVADVSSPERSGWIYVVSSRNMRDENGMLRFSVWVARSADGGRRFDPGIHVRPNNLLILAETPVVLSDGTLVVSYVEAGTSDGRSVLLRRRAWVVRSSDGGETFGRPEFVNEDCGPPDQFSLSALAADVSRSPWRDRLYFVCNQPGMGAVLLNHSPDSGQVWTEVIPVHRAPPDTSIHRHLMAAAVNSNGVVGVMWADGRHRPETDCYDVYLGASIDGGDTFLPEQRVSTTTSCADSTAMGGRIPWSEGGDYWGMAADNRGRFRLLWSDARDGIFRLRSAIVEVNTSAEQRN